MSSPKEDYCTTVLSNGEAIVCKQRLLYPAYVTEDKNLLIPREEGDSEDKCFCLFRRGNNGR